MTTETLLLEDTTCRKSEHLSTGALCYHTLTQHIYDFIVQK
jgi:hypothetical protein